MSYITKRSYSAENDTRSYQQGNPYHFRIIDFVNLTNEQVVILDRQNVPVILPAAPPGTIMNPPRVEIRQHFQFFETKAVQEMEHAVNFLNTQLKGLGEERRILHETLVKEKTQGHQKHLSFTTIRKIPYSDMLSSNAIFDQESGFMITRNNAHLTCVHPESLDGRMLGDHESFVQSRPTGFLIEIVDNEKLIRQRFTYACNDVIKVTAIQDLTRVSGVYVSTITDVGHSKSIIDTVCMTLAEAEKKLGLYVTEEEAMTNGNPEILAQHISDKMKMDFEKTKADNAVLDLENKRIESDYKHKLMQSEAKLKEKLMNLDAEQKQKLMKMEEKDKKKSHEISKLKEEIEKRKLVRTEYYDSRSQDRKDTSEMIKFIPAVLMGFIGAALLFRK